MSATNRSEERTVGPARGLSFSGAIAARIIGWGRRAATEAAPTRTQISPSPNGMSQVVSAPATEQRLYGATPDGAALLEIPAAVGAASAVINLVAPGVYEGLRTFGGERFFGLRSHLERLQDSIDGFRTPLDYSEEVFVRALDAAARDAAAAFGCEARIRIDVAAERPERLGTTSNVLIAATPFRGLPEAIVEGGAHIASAPGLSRPDPAVKTSDFIPLREAWIAAHGDPDAYEHVMLDGEGHLLEGTQSNVVFVRDGQLHVPPSGILPGVTLRAVCDLAEEDGFVVHREFVPLDDLGTFDEVFMTTSVRSVVPVSRFDEFEFLHPAPVTARLSELYDALAEEDSRVVAERNEARY